MLLYFRYKQNQYSDRSALQHLIYLFTQLTATAFCSGTNTTYWRLTRQHSYSLFIYKIKFSETLSPIVRLRIIGTQTIGKGKIYFSVNYLINLLIFFLHYIKSTAFKLPSFCVYNVEFSPKYVFIKVLFNLIRRTAILSASPTISWFVDICTFDIYIYRKQLFYTKIIANVNVSILPIQHHCILLYSKGSITNFDQYT